MLFSLNSKIYYFTVTKLNLKVCILIEIDLIMG